MSTFVYAMLRDGTVVYDGPAGEHFGVEVYGNNGLNSGRHGYTRNQEIHYFRYGREHGQTSIRQYTYDGSWFKEVPEISAIPDPVVLAIATMIVQEREKPTPITQAKRKLKPPLEARVDAAA